MRWLEGNTAVSTDPVFTFTVSGSRSLKAEFAKIGTPSLKSVKPAGYDSMLITWKGVPGVSGYALYRSTSARGKYTEIARLNGLNDTDTGLQTGKSYCYKIRAYYTADTVTTYSGYSSVKYAKPVPAAPQISAVSEASGVKIAWAAVPGASKYMVYRSASKKGGYKLIGMVAELQFADSSAKPAKKYYKVKACAGCGKSSVTSKDSNIVVFN